MPKKVATKPEARASRSKSKISESIAPKKPQTKSNLKVVKKVVPKQNITKNIVLKPKRSAPSKIEENKIVKKQKINAGKAKVVVIEKQKSKKESKKDAKVKDKAKNVIAKKQEEKSEVQVAKNDETKIVKAIKKFGAVVDTHCPISNQVHVLKDSLKTYDTTLNQSNLTQNNNKFYVLQVLQKDANSDQYYFWTRWGRVGVPGQNALAGPLSKDSAINLYEKKLHEKTVKGDYTVIEIAHDDENNEENKIEVAKGKTMKVSVTVDLKRGRSLLDNRLQGLIRLIFDLKMMNTQMKEIGYDAKKMPLGKLAKSTIQQGYEVLNNLMTAIEKKKGKSEYEQLSSRFYSLIPHDFGFQKMSNFILDSEEKVKLKLDMLQSLSDIQIATKLLSQESAPDENILDSNYRKLNCSIRPLDLKSKEYSIINQYITNTKGSWKIDLNDVFEIERSCENERFKDVGNKMLLWHGSRLANFVGILSQGLRIAPPEAPASGYRFGKGIYFADMIAKSAGYCGAYGTEALALLGEVSCGVFNEKHGSDFNASNLPKGKHSTLGVGQGPPKNTWIKIEKDIQVPVGDEKSCKNIGWNHNEYIVYDVAQVKLRYLVRMKFN